MITETAPATGKEEKEELVRRYRRAKEVFSIAVSLEPTKRSDFVETSCGDDRALRDEVEGLLAHDAERILFRGTVPRMVLIELASLLERDAGNKD